MNEEAMKQVATRDGQSIKGTSIGVAINFIMDYGNGRQLTISSTLPLDARLPEYNAELDKLRKTTNRQQAYITVRNRQAQLLANKKMLQVEERALAEFTKEADTAIAELASGPKADHTVNKNNRETVRQQFIIAQQEKRKRIVDLKGEIEVCEVIIAGAEKEIEEIDKEV
jgi:hypothetical protein